jgi:hypothetical protein
MPERISHSRLIRANRLKTHGRDRGHEHQTCFQCFHVSGLARSPLACQGGSIEGPNSGFEFQSERRAFAQAASVIATASQGLMPLTFRPDLRQQLIVGFLEFVEKIHAHLQLLRYSANRFRSVFVAGS